MTGSTVIASPDPSLDVPASDRLISVVVPVYNEGENIVPCLRGLWGALRDTAHEILVCYDFDADTTLPALRNMTDCPPTVRLVKNDLGKGVVNALRAGFNAARGDVVVTTMADLSDPPGRILPMADKIRAGNAVVSGSRYMRGGSQSGGPLVKRTLSRVAGLSLWWMAGMNTHDATTNFRAYSRDFLRSTKVQSKSGFEVALELTTRAHNTGLGVDEVPSTWTDRTAGESRFKLMKWLPGYLYWFMTTMWPALLVWGVWLGMTISAGVFVHKYAVDLPFMEECEHLPFLVGERPVTWEWLWSQELGEHRLPLPRVLHLAMTGSTGWGTVDFRRGTYLNVALLSVAAFALVLGVRQGRGRMSWTDLILPMCLMGLIHADNLLSSYQVIFTAPLLLLCVVVGVMIGHADKASFGITWLFALGLILLPFAGGAGVLFAVPIACWAFATGVARMRRGDRAGLVWCIASATAIVVTMFYFSNFHRHPSAPQFSLPSTLRGFVEYMSTVFGPAAQKGHAAWASLAIVLVLVGAWTTLRALFDREHRPTDRWRAAALCAALCAGGAVALGVAVSRGPFGPGYGMVGRYVTLSVPLLLFTYIATELLGGRLVQRVTSLTILIVPLVLAQPNLVSARAAGSWRVRENARLIQDVRAGLPVEVVAERHEGIYPDLSNYLKVMDEHRIGPFRDPTLHLAGHARWAEIDIPVASGQWLDAEFRGGAWTATGPDPQIIFRLPAPVRVKGIRLTFTLDNAPHLPATCQVYWSTAAGGFGEQGRVSTWRQWVGDFEQLHTVWIDDTIDAFRFDPDMRSDVPCRVRLKSVQLLVPGDSR